MANYIIKQMSPQLQITDMDRAIQFYAEYLCFEVDFRYEDFYAGIVKNGYSIHLKLIDHPKKLEKRDDDSPLDIMFSVDNIARLYEELSAKNVQFVQPLRQMPYGKEFYLADPNGNVIAFTETSN